MVNKATCRDYKPAVKILEKRKSEKREMVFLNLGWVWEWVVVGHWGMGYRSLLDNVSSCGIGRHRSNVWITEWQRKAGEYWAYLKAWDILKLNLVKGQVILAYCLTKKGVSG